MAHLYLWREPSGFELDAAAIARKLAGGDDVPGLIDLPIRDMLDVVKTHFPGGKETAGQWQWQSGAERIEATWSWQFLSFDVQQLTDEHRENIFELARQFHCPVFDTSLGIRLE
jgi:hypothetical protein